MPSITFTEGPLEGESLEIDAPIVLGRHAADVILPDPDISRRHAELRRVGDGLLLTDLASANGTHVNGTLITEPRRLEHGDVIAIGATRIEVVLDDSAAPTVIRRLEPEPPPAPRSAPTPSPVLPPSAAFAPPANTGRQGIATRTLAPTAIAIAVILLTGVGLLAYFVLR